MTPERYALTRRVLLDGCLRARAHAEPFSSASLICWQRDLAYLRLTYYGASL